MKNRNKLKDKFSIYYKISAVFGTICYIIGLIIDSTLFLSMAVAFAGSIGLIFAFFKDTISLLSYDIGFIDGKIEMLDIIRNKTKKVKGKTKK